MNAPNAEVLRIEYISKIALYRCVENLLSNNHNKVGTRKPIFEGTLRKQLLIIITCHYLSPTYHLTITYFIVPRIPLIAAGRSPGNRTILEFGDDDTPFSASIYFSPRR